MKVSRAKHRSYQEENCDPGVERCTDDAEEKRLRQSTAEGEHISHKVKLGNLD
jgi:hypothetical protein